MQQSRAGGSRAGAHAQTLHERSFRNLVLPHLQLDELRTRLRSHTQVLWLWVAVDPPSQMHSSAATGSSYASDGPVACPQAARAVGSWLPAPLHQRWPSCLFLCLDSSFWVLDEGNWEQQEGAAVAGGGRLAVWPSHKALPATAVGTGQAGDPAGNRASVHASFTGIGLFWTSKHGLYRAGQSDDPSWRGRSGTTHVGDSPPSSPPAGSPLLVASVLSLCTSSRLTARSLGAGTRGRWDTSEATLSTADASHGSWQNQSQVDSRRGALLPAATGPRLKAGEASHGPKKWPWNGWVKRETRQRRVSFEDETTCLPGNMAKNQPKRREQSLGELSTISKSCTSRSVENNSDDVFILQSITCCLVELIIKWLEEP
jgi:hypothetical protein